MFSPFGLKRTWIFQHLCEYKREADDVGEESDRLVDKSGIILKKAYTAKTGRGNTGLQKDLGAICSFKKPRCCFFLLR